MSDDDLLEADDDLLDPEDANEDSGEDLAADWGMALEEQGADVDDLSAEWTAMLEEGEPELEEQNQSSANRILKQGEVDALMGFRLEDHFGGEREGVRAIIDSAMVSYERLPMLEILFDRLVRLATASLRNFTSDNVEVSTDDMISMRYGDYIDSIPLPCIIAVFKIIEWDSYGLMTVDSDLIYSIIDVLLGGRNHEGNVVVEGRPYTTIETDLVSRMLEIILEDTCEAFAPVAKITFKLERLETNPRFAAVSRRANATIIMPFRIDMENRGGTFRFVLPYATIEPIRELLLRNFMGERLGRDPIWEEHLATQVWHAETNISAVLAEQNLPITHVLALKAGETLLFDSAKTSALSLTCNGVPLAKGREAEGDGVQRSVLMTSHLRQPSITLGTFLADDTPGAT